MSFLSCPYYSTSCIVQQKEKLTKIDLSLSQDTKFDERVAGGKRNQLEENGFSFCAFGLVVTGLGLVGAGSCLSVEGDCINFIDINIYLSKYFRSHRFIDTQYNLFFWFYISFPTWQSEQYVNFEFFITDLGWRRKVNGFSLLDLDTVIIIQ